MTQTFNYFQIIPEECVNCPYKEWSKFIDCSWHWYMVWNGEMPKQVYGKCYLAEEGEKDE